MLGGCAVKTSYKIKFIQLSLQLFVNFKYNLLSDIYQRDVTYEYTFYNDSTGNINLYIKSDILCNVWICNSFFVLYQETG